MIERDDPRVAMHEDSEALDRAALGSPSIRVYRWTDVCVTLGRHQAAKDILVDPDRYPYAERPTGGGAVLHGHDITLTAAIPLRSRPSVRELYTSLAGLVVEYLELHGIPAGLASTAQGRSSIGYCFAEIAPTDLVHLETGAKICGCALRVTRQAALLQCSIPYRAPRVNPGDVIREAIWTELPEWQPGPDFDPSQLVTWTHLVSV